MSDHDTTWIVFRDERKADYAAKVADCIAAFERKLGAKATVVGVVSTIPADVEAQLQQRGLRVVQNLHAWQKDEVWVGRELA
jgi:hypothetical protein